MDTRNFGATAGLGALGSGIGSLLMGHGNDPFKAGNKYFNQIPGAVNPYFQPWMQAGQGALGKLNEQFMGLTNDPTAAYNKFAAGYHESPGYKWQLNQGTNAVNNAAAAGGMLGSPEHQQNAATLTQGLANQDFNNYMSQALGLYGTGLSGLQGLNTQGYGANSQMANIMQSLLAGQGYNAANQAAAENQSKGTAWGNIFGGVASLLPFLAGL